MKSLQEWKIFQNSKSSEMKRVAYLDNPHRIMDNVARLSQVLLFGFTAFILITGGIFHYEMFSLSMGNGALSIGFALGFFLIIEVLKVVLGRQLLRGIFSGDAGESKIHAFAYSLMFCLTVFGFWWSWEISTNAAPTLNKVINFAEGKSNHTNEDEAKRLAAEIAAIDQQIAVTTQSEQTGFSIRYRGVVTQEGQKIAKTAANTRQRLTDQRTALLDRLNGEKDRTRSLNETQLSSAANQLGQYGGFAEILQAIFMLLAGLCEVISYMKNKKDIESGILTDMKTGLQKHLTIHQKDINQNPALNERKIGFQYNNKDVQVETPTPSKEIELNYSKLPEHQRVTIATDLATELKANTITEVDRQLMNINPIVYIENGKYSLDVNDVNALERKFTSTPTPSVVEAREIELTPTHSQPPKADKIAETVVQQVAQVTQVTKEVLGRWKSDSNTYFKRSMTQKSKEARENSFQTYMGLRRKLIGVGVQIEETADGLEFPNFDAIRNTFPSANKEVNHE